MVISHLLLQFLLLRTGSSLYHDRGHPTAPRVTTRRRSTLAESLLPKDPLRVHLLVSYPFKGLSQFELLNMSIVAQMGRTLYLIRRARQFVCEVHGLPTFLVLTIGQLRELLL